MMLKSYEAIYENGRLKWLEAPPPVNSARIIVTILEETPSPVKRRSAPAVIAGKGKTLGDLIKPIVDE
jgi:hypothetical protein